MVAGCQSRSLVNLGLAARPVSWRWSSAFPGNANLPIGAVSSLTDASVRSRRETMNEAIAVGQVPARFASSCSVSLAHLVDLRCTLRHTNVIRQA